MKQKIAKFLLFVYLNYIQEEWEIYNSAGKIFIYPAWFIRSFFIWLLCPFLIPDYLIKQSTVYKILKDMHARGLMLTPKQLIELSKKKK